MRAFHGDATLKANLLSQIAEHERHDQIIKGSYGKQNGAWRGCAIGCALHSLNLLQGLNPTEAARGTGIHERFPAELEIPIELAYLIDHTFESLPAPDFATWPRRVIDAMPVGADLTGVMPALLQWMLLDDVHGLRALARNDRERVAFTQFAAMIAHDWAGETIAMAEWDALDAELLASGRLWAGARARAWAGAGAWARAWAGARAWAWAGAKYSILANQLLVLLRATEEKH